MPIGTGKSKNLYNANIIRRPQRFPSMLYTFGNVLCNLQSPDWISCCNTRTIPFAVNNV